MTLIPFQFANDISDRFLALLSNRGIWPPQGSKIKDELHSLAQLLEISKNPTSAKGFNKEIVLRTAAGLHDFAAKLLSVEGIVEFEQFVPHLRLISKIDPGSFGQNAASGVFDDTARKMAELYLACLAAHVGTDVVLDHPNKSNGSNPDVMFNLEPIDVPQQRWALAIKTMSSSKGQTIFEQIKKAAAQIDDSKCNADKGMVVINMKSALDHSALWNGIYLDEETAREAPGAQLDKLIEDSTLDRPQDDWDEIFKHRVVRPVLFLGQSLVRLKTPKGSHIPTPLKVLRAFHANGPKDVVGSSLAELMNHYMQTILNGKPGGIGFPPS